MSDQVSQEFNTNFAGGGGGAGITSINGDATPAQLIVQSTGIKVSDAGATHSIANLGVLSVAKQGSPARNGAIVLKPSVSLTITEGPNGTYEFDAVGASGITEINGDPTAHQVLAAGAGISITPGPAGTNTIAATGAGLGVTDINLDNSASQFLQSATGIEITDPGGGQHLFTPPTFRELSTLGAAGIALPNGALVATASLTIPVAFGVASTVLIYFAGGLNGIANQLMDCGVRVNGVVLTGHGFSGIQETAGQTCNVAGCAGVHVVAPGDVVDVFIVHHGGGAATTSLACTIGAIKLH